MVEVENGCISNMKVSFHLVGHFPLNHDDMGESVKATIFAATPLVSTPSPGPHSFFEILRLEKLAQPESQGDRHFRPLNRRSGGYGEVNSYPIGSMGRTIYLLIHGWLILMVN